LLLGSGLGKQQAVLLDNVEAFEVRSPTAHREAETAKAHRG